MAEVGQAYFDTAHSISEARQMGDYVPKRLTYAGFLRVMLRRWSWKLHDWRSGIQMRLHAGYQRSRAAGNQNKPMLGA